MGLVQTWTGDMDAALRSAAAEGFSARAAALRVSELARRPVSRSAAIGYAHRNGIAFDGGQPVPAERRQATPERPERQAPRTERQATPERAPRPARQAILLAATVGRPFAALAADSCRWPVADGADWIEAGTQFLFCAAAAKPDRAIGGACYCAAHAREARP